MPRHKMQSVAHWEVANFDRARQAGDALVEIGHHTLSVGVILYLAVRGGGIAHQVGPSLLLEFPPSTTLFLIHEAIVP